MGLVAVAPGGFAQVVLDGSLGPEGALAGPDYEIPAAVGRQVGTNLFHSFSAFAIPPGASATFSGPAEIQAVVGRVTGGAASTIDGTLRSTMPGADVYLANPAGVVFGPNARLEVGGAFHAPTGDVLVMGDGSRLATGETAGAGLSVAPVTAFGFWGANAPVAVTGGELRGAPGQGLALSGGDVTVEGLVAAPGGRLDVAAVGQRTVELAANTWQPMSEEATLGTVTVGVGGILSIAGAEGGRVRVRGASLAVDGGVIDATAGDRAGGEVRLVLDDSVQLVNDGQLLLGVTGSGPGAHLMVQTRELLLGPASGLPVENPGIAAAVVPGATGSAGRLDVAVQTLRIVDNRIDATTAGAGDAARVAIDAEHFEIRGNTYFAPFDFFAGVSGATTAEGRGAEVSIRARDIVFFGDAGVLVNTFGPGDARDLVVDAVTIDIDGGPGGQPVTINSGFTNGTFGAGDGGRVQVRTDVLSLRRGGAVATITLGSGFGGDVEVEAQTLFMDGENTPTTTVIPTASGGSGRGGDITVRTGSLTLRNANTAITADTGGVGDAGNVSVEADTIVVAGNGTDLATAISSGTFPGSTGRGGTLTVHTGDLQVRAGGAVTSSTFGAGPAGQLDLEADTATVGEGGFVGTLTAGPGPGGNLQLRVETLTVVGSGSVRADAVPETLGIDVGAGGSPFEGGNTPTTDQPFGDAGNIAIEAHGVVLEDGGSILARTVNSGGGNIAIAAQRLVLGDGGTVNASVSSGDAGGGNVVVEATAVVARDGSAIVARADRGLGGNILLEADVFLRSGAVILDASSNVAGNAGAVAVNAPELDLNGQLLALALRFFDSSAALGGCRASASGGSGFAVNRLNSGAVDPAGLRLSRIELTPLDAFLTRAEGSGEPLAGPPVAHVVGCQRLAG
ncbi:MAG: filamentous hemagglutinin N-terminal domain-containing protein [Candidatus Competibacterales bacterium]